jgi:hypothetical protein
MTVAKPTAVSYMVACVEAPSGGGGGGGDNHRIRESCMAIGG